MAQNINAMPLNYELNGRISGRHFDDVTRRDLANFRRLSFSHIWLMGIWRINPGALTISRQFGTDFEGSPTSPTRCSATHQPVALFGSAPTARGSAS